MLDYKLSEEREENGLIYQKVRFYEGDVTTEDEYDPIAEQVVPITCYRRTLLVQEVEYWYDN